MKVMRPLVCLGFFLVMLTTTQTFAGDITFDAVETKHWLTVNDNVMGGVSSSHFAYQDGYGVFSGYVSLENNGGFASVRRIISPNFSSASTINLTIMGDGRRYQFRLKTHRLYEGAAYVAEFTTTANQWQTIQLSESDFSPRYRGRTLSAMPSLKFSDAIQVGLLIADKKAGEFQLRIKSIQLLQSI